MPDMKVLEELLLLLTEDRGLVKIIYILAIRSLRWFISF